MMNRKRDFSKHDTKQKRSEYLQMQQKHFSFYSLVIFKIIHRTATQPSPRADRHFHPNLGKCIANTVPGRVTVVAIVTRLKV